jgi:metal-sulfur cluster biosynthetic enzyme
MKRPALFSSWREAALPKAVCNQLRQCLDPEIPVKMVDLGVVYDCQLTKRRELVHANPRMKRDTIKFFAALTLKNFAS